jgi:protein gp37
MGDLFHEKVSDELINDVFSMMVHPLSGTSHHTFLLLTKRPDRILKCHYERFREWPNIHLGVSVESQKHLWRVEKLLKIPARVRFVSAEPLLGPIDFPKKTLGQGSDCPECGYMVRVDEDGLCASCGRDVMWYGIDWVIVGKETGPGARRMDIEWARKIRDDCKAAGVPFFMKKIPEDQGPAGDLMIREYPKAV